MYNLIHKHNINAKLAEKVEHAWKSLSSSFRANNSYTMYILETISLTHTSKVIYLRCIFWYYLHPWFGECTAHKQITMCECLIFVVRCHVSIYNFFLSARWRLCASNPFHMYRLSIIASYRDYFIIDQIEQCVAELPCRGGPHEIIFKQYNNKIRKQKIEWYNHVRWWYFLLWA